MRLPALVLVALLCLCGAALAQRSPPEPTPLPVGVTNRDVAVTSDYRGASVTVYGVNPAANRGGDVVIVLRGPDRPQRVMRKRRILGLWINSDPVTFTAAPSYFAVYSTRPVTQILDAQQLWRYRLNVAALAELGGEVPGDADPADYRRALVRLKGREGLYRTNSSGVRVEESVLFQADFALPANAPLGSYTIQTFVFRNGVLLSQKDDQVVVDRRGVERTVYDLATHYSFFYGLLTVGLALLSGWVAAMVFRRS
ncbi:MAG: TIGR02186 family protein [Caulobacterales bacterium]